MKAIGSVAKARAFVAAHGIVALVRDPRMPSLVDAIAGAPVKGSWWSHPRGKKIFEIASALEDDPRILVTKLGGRVRFVDRRLVPALVRVVTDPGFRAAKKKKLGPEAKRLLARVERSGRARVDAPKDKAARAEIEASDLVRVTSEHTEHGRHAIVLQRWSAWAPAATARAADKLSLDAARAALDEAGLVL